MAEHILMTPDKITEHLNIYTRWVLQLSEHAQILPSRHFLGQTCCHWRRCKTTDLVAGGVPSVAQAAKGAADGKSGHIFWSIVKTTHMLDVPMSMIKQRLFLEVHLVPIICGDRCFWRANEVRRWTEEQGACDPATAVLAVWHGSQQKDDPHRAEMKHSREGQS